MFFSFTRVLFLSASITLLISDFDDSFLKVDIGLPLFSMILLFQIITPSLQDDFLFLKFKKSILRRLSISLVSVYVLFFFVVSQA